jgi:16S rRNA (guanine527-N7)-methyltransferase
METGAPATVHACRIEDAQIPPAPLVTARALAPLRGLLGLARPLLESGGTCLFLKGAKAAEEIAEARAGWRMMVDAIPSRTHDGGAILRITGLESL